MADPPIATMVPWEFRPGTLLPIPSAALGALVVLALLVVFFLFHWLFGFPISSAEELLTPTARNSLYTVLLLGYAFAALRFGALGIEADLLRADPSGGWEYGWFPAEIVRRSRWAGGAAVLAGVVLIDVVARMKGFAMTAPWTEIHEASLYLWLLLVFFWILGRAAFFTIYGSQSAAGLSVGEAEIDLLDPRALLAFGRIGLRFALLWIVGVTIAAPFLLGPTLDVYVLLGALAVVGVIALVALLLPVVPIHRRIRAEKHDELSRVAAAIAGDEAALTRTRIAGRRTQPGLADLVAYRSLIESVREWPFDTPTLSRFVLYLLIPLASWIAAALVERGLDAALR